MPGCRGEICPLFTDLGPGSVRVEIARADLSKVLAKVLVAITFFVLVSLFLQLGHAAWRSGGLQLMHAAWRWWRTVDLLRWARSLIPTKRHEDPLNKKLDERMEGFRRQFRKKCLVFMSFLAVCQVTIDFVRWGLVGLLFAEPTDRFAAYILYEGTFPIAATYVILAWLAYSFPSALSRRDVHIATMILLECRWQLSLYFTREMIYVHEGYKMAEWPLRIFLLLGESSMVLVFLFNGACCFTAVVTRMNLFGDCRQGMITQELIVLGTSTAIVLIFGDVLRRQIRATLVAKSSGRVELAVESLMSGMCDSVIHVDTDWRVLKPANTLAALILLASGTNLVGSSFLDLVKDESDKARLRQALRRAVGDGGGAGPAGSLHVNLRDTCGVSVPVQIFHTECEDSLGSTFYIVGVREFGDQARAGPTSSESSAPQASWEDRPEGPCGVTGARPTEPVVPSNYTTTLRMSRENDRRSNDRDWRSNDRDSFESISEHLSVESSTAPLPLCMPQHEHEVAVFVDTGQDGFPILMCTPEFVLKIGGPSLTLSSPFLGMAADASGLRDRVLKALEALGRTGAGTSGDAISVALYPSFLNKHHLNAKLCISSVQSHPQGGLFDDHPCAVQLLLHNIVLVKTKSGKEARRASRRPSKTRADYDRVLANFAQIEAQQGALVQL